MKVFDSNGPLKIHPFKLWLSSKWNVIKSWDRKEVFVTITIVLTIVLFMYTALSKLLHHSVFVFQMRRAPLPLMQLLAPVIGWIVPIVELVLVVLLYLDRTRYWGMVGSLVLMVSFEAYITWMKIMEMQTGVRLPCTCGGVISNMGWTAHLIFNAFFIFLLALSVYYERKKGKLNQIR